MKKHLSRRDFLSAAGAVPISASVCLPSLTTLLLDGRALAAAGCEKAEVASDAPAFIGIDLQGGASIAGNNIMVYDRGGDLLSDYRGLGLPTALAPHLDGMINHEAGLAMHAASPMLRGIRAVAADALAKVSGCVICTQSADDTASNRLASAPGIFVAGGGGLVTPLVGTRPSFPGGSGGNSATPFPSGVTPAFIRDIASATQLISPGDFWKRSPRKMAGVLALLEDLSETQLQQFSRLSLPEQAREMIKCGYLDAKDLLTANDGESSAVTASDLDPRRHPKLAALNRAGVLRGVSEAAVEVAYLSLMGYAGAGTIAMGGYDYHDGTATTGEERDERAGEVIGTVLAMAAALERKLMLHVYTDGGVDANVNAAAEDVGDGVEKYVWRGDSETRAAAFVLLYDPSGRPDLVFKQMGAYRAADGGTVDLNPERHGKISENPGAHATAVLANWLAWQGREGELQKIVQGSPIRAEELDDYLFIRKA